MIIGQYYQFVRLGFEGYKKIMASLLNVATRLQEGIEKLGMLWKSKSSRTQHMYLACKLEGSTGNSWQDRCLPYSSSVAAAWLVVA